MENRDEERVDLLPEISALLMSTRPAVPPRFVLKARMKFEQVLALRHLRRLVLTAVSLFLAASVCIWVLILNVGKFGDAVWEGFFGAAALIRSVFTLWDRLPFIGMTVAMAAMLFSWVLYGVVAKLDRRMLSAK